MAKKTKEPKEVDSDEYDETSYGCCQITDDTLKNIKECDGCQYKENESGCDQIRENEGLTKLRIEKYTEVHYYIADDEEE